MSLHNLAHGLQVRGKIRDQHAALFADDLLRFGVDLLALFPILFGAPGGDQFVHGGIAPTAFVIKAIRTISQRQDSIRVAKDRPPTDEEGCLHILLAPKITYRHLINGDRKAGGFDHLLDRNSGIVDPWPTDVGRRQSDFDAIRIPGLG